MQAYELYFRKNKLPKFHRSGLIYDYQNTINQKNIFKKKPKNTQRYVLYYILFYIVSSRVCGNELKKLHTLKFLLQNA